MNMNVIPKDELTYLFYWCCERMNIFWKKYNGERSPWTDDEILQNFKFTNVYRVLDRSSQYLLRNVIYNGKQYEPEDMFFRVLLYKMFNLPTTWDILVKEFGDITYNTGWENISKFLDDAVARGLILYSNAYILSGHFYQLPRYAYISGMPKHRGYFEVFKNEIFENGHIYDFLDADSFEVLFGLFKELAPFGDFMAQQLCLDMNYSPLYNFTENDFVVLGPGSKRGVSFAFMDYNKHKAEEVIRWVSDHFTERITTFCADSGMIWNPLPWEPVPTLTNIQNCFCELSKYAKGLGVRFNNKPNSRIKNVYTAATADIQYMFPPKWGVELPLKGVVKTY